MLHLVESAEALGPASNASRTTAHIIDEARLATVVRYEVLDTPPEAAFDRITAFAADLFDAPISIISFLARDRLWFKSHHGLDATEVSWGPDASASAVELRMRREFNLGFFVGMPLRTHDGYDLGTLCVIDQQPRQVDEKQIRHLKALAAIVMDHLELRLIARTAAARAKLMASEIDHRAMNSLQLVASLLSLQSEGVREPEASQQLRAAADRVRAVARVHRHFSADEAANSVPVLSYLCRLCGELSVSLAASIEVEGVEASVPVAQILAIGLIINELVTNAKKHGSEPIKVTFTIGVMGQYDLCVLDEGKGLPEGFMANEDGGDGLGMKVVKALVEQLDGVLSAARNPAGRGACFTVSFPSAERTKAGNIGQLLS